MKLKCAFINNLIGKPCGNWALKGETLCFWHSKREDIVIKRRAAQQEGARQTHLKHKGGVVFQRLNTIKDLAIYHRDLIKSFASGEMENDDRFKLLSEAIVRQQSLMSDYYIEKDRKSHKHSVGINSPSTEEKPKIESEEEQTNTMD